MTPASRIFRTVSKVIKIKLPAIQIHPVSRLVLTNIPCLVSSDNKTSGPTVSTIEFTISNSELNKIELS